MKWGAMNKAEDPRKMPIATIRRAWDQVKKETQALSIGFEEKSLWSGFLVGVRASERFMLAWCDAKGIEAPAVGHEIERSLDARQANGKD